MSENQKIGLFFGSFNPIHIGHLIIANAMAENTDLKKVWLVVSPQNPLKPSKGLLHEFDRYDMAKAAIADHYKIEVSDVEFHLPKPSYTIHTLAHLHEKHPEKDFKVIVGEDNLASFAKWKNYEQILEHYGLYVYPRPHVTNSDFKRHPNVKLVEAPLLDISATYIRECIKNNKSIRYLVPESVETMIRLKGFYK
ncbi:MAG: nicotinate (nicotinamide) nucleotide adenylyltransferase [Bacteroidota bacterium]|jgi:nicotinate-nucleotide adenylyltransferase|nr:nicotinate-nucleotide adenylyltransferase [Cytophagales bacterium]MCE2957855.1 nicotinate-nucleotide adenylyltransferase [Flammeovirgaceae bacterium]MCZ8072174.1 nicotinate (nicotinamide) nucleotide adenylyltransferase [Cytophagales bacterium]